MSRVRVLVGTRKGAFVLHADGRRKQWTIEGPHFPGREIFHLKGSEAEPNRIFASQSSSGFGQLIQRSEDGGQTWNPVGIEFSDAGPTGNTARANDAPTSVSLPANATSRTNR